MLRFLPPAAAAATGILVGSAMVATRFVIDQTAPAFLAERLSTMSLLGLACVALGLWLAHRHGPASAS